MIIQKDWTIFRWLFWAFVIVVLGLAAGLRGENKDNIVFKRVSIEDQNMIGGEAVSFLAPKDWKVEGGIVWRAHPALPAASHVRVHDPAAATHVEVFPSAPFTWGDLCGPGKLMPVGSSWFGNEVAPPFDSAADLLHKTLLRRLRGDVDYKIFKTTELPDLARACQRNAPQADPGVTLTYNAAAVTMQYAVGGVSVEEEFTCVLATMKIPTGNITIQIADPVFSIRASPGELENHRALLTAILASSKINPKWLNKYLQLVEAIVKQKMQEIRDTGEFSRMLARCSNEITRERQVKIDETQNARDQLDREWNEHNRGIETYNDPNEGRPVELPSGYGHAWTSRNGEYVLTDNPNFNPNVTMNGTWQEMVHTP